MSTEVAPEKINPRGFGPVSKTLHWLIALHMIALIALGWWMIDLSFYSSWYYWAPYLHKGFGIVVFVLGCLLLLWRTISVRPAALPSHSRFEKIASKTAHLLLFSSVLIIPVSGYIFTTSNGEGIDLFGVATVPALFGVSDRVRDMAIDVHIYASYGLLAVIGAHAGGALKHHFIDKDQTLRRMTF